MRVKLEKFESWIERNHRLVLTLILGANLFLCLALFDPKPSCGGDNASYIIMAHVNKALGLEEESAWCLNRAFSLGVTDLGLTAIGKKLNIELTSIQDTTFSDR